MLYNKVLLWHSMVATVTSPVPPRGLKIGKHEKGKRDLIILLMAGEEPGDEMDRKYHTLGSLRPASMLC